MNKIRSLLFILLLGLVFFGLAGRSPLIAEDKSGLQATNEIPQHESRADKKEKKEPEEEKIVLHNEITVTATLTKKTTFDSPQPVSVVNERKILEAAPNNVTDLFYEMPGMDAVGVGANQSRPVIRGLRGQRILLMEDGIRLHNARRQQDFGEIPALVEISNVQRVEVVRGPSSVLFGSDAIGGVINIITKGPEYKEDGSAVHGSLGYRFSSADRQNKGFGTISGNLGKFGFRLSGALRKADDYRAPSGTFGNIHLANETDVKDSGVSDDSLSVFLGYRFSENHDILFKFENYRAENSGFGYVDPAAYAPESPLIQILYPRQEMQKLTLSYENRDLRFALADVIHWTSYHIRNKRHLDMNIFIPFNIPGLKDAGLSTVSTNYANVGTFGSRIEFTKVLSQKHLLIYGVDFIQDDSENTDSNTTTVVGFGPLRPSLDTTPQLPNAMYRSSGAFVQDEWFLFPRASLILGLRYQNVKARTKATPGLENVPIFNSTDKTFVAATNLSYGLTDNIRIAVSLGRGFRSPNLIERFFHGTTPEGNGFLTRNPDLRAETSLNFDVGLKYRLDHLYLESSYFRNTLHDGIQIVPTGQFIGNLPEYKNVNIDRLLLTGVEFLGEIDFGRGLGLGANYTHINSENLANPELPYSNTYSSKLDVFARYDHPKDAFFVEYGIRVNGSQKNVELINNPIGDIIPGFNVHTLRAGITFFKSTSFPQQLGVIVSNLTNALYAEFANATFFRPAPKRQIILTWTSRF